MQHWIDLFTGQVKATTWLEWAAVMLGVAEVLLARANKVWLYPTGIAATLISIYLLLNAMLYAECLLSLYYVVMSVYGWYHWIKKRHEPAVKVSFSTRQEWMITLLIVFGGWAVLYVVLVKFTPSTVPIWDSWVSSTAWAGMWLLARRKVENWVLLNISNLFAIPLLYHKNLAMFALLTLILFIVAVFGYFDWRKIAAPQPPEGGAFETLKNSAPPSGGRGVHPSALLKPEWVAIIRDNAPEAEGLGKLHPAQLQLVYDRQWFNLLAPAVYGGLQTPLPELIKIEEALSWADGSLGWVVTLCCGAGWFGGFIDPNIAQQIYSDKEACLAGSGAPTGTAVISGDGYIINGSWKYASGVHHATYITVNCNIVDGETPVLNTDGTPLILPFVLDRKDVQLQSGWKYIGMIATGSDAYSVTNLYVDKNRCFKIDPGATVIDSLLYTYPFLQLAEATLAANISGTAVHFIDLCVPAFANKATNIRRVSPANVLVMDEALQSATALLNQARAALFTAVEASWANPTDEVLLKEVSHTSRVLAKVSRECVDELYPYCGLLAASPDSEINRVWRDLHTASQHALLTFSA